MKKNRLIALLAAAVIAVAGTPALDETPLSVTSYAASTKLSAPSGFKAASKTSSSVKLTWSKVKGASAYSVYMYDKAAGKFVAYKTVTGTSCTVKQLSPSTQYQFRVAALVKSGSKYVAQKKSGTLKVKTSANNVKVDTSIKPTKKIKFFSTWEMNKNDTRENLFISTYGVPEKSKSDTIFEWIPVAYGEQYTKLASLISSGNSPDMMPFEPNFFPYTAYKGWFQPIDGIVDTNTSEWSSTRAVMDQFMWAGKNYVPITSVDISHFWFYRKSVVKGAGLTDPYKLFNDGTWDWDNALDMAKKFSKTGESKYFCDGWYTGPDLVLTSGTPLVSIKDGKLVNNIDSSAVKRAMKNIADIAKYVFPKADHGWMTSPETWAKGDTLFYIDGAWFFDGDAQKLAKNNGFTTDDIFFVPAPRDPKAKKYYSTATTDSFVLIKGSTNTESYKAWINCCLKAANDKNMKADARKARLEMGWTKAQLDFLDEINSGAVAPLYELIDGVNAPNTNDSLSNMVGNVVINDPEADYNAVLTDIKSDVDKAVKILNKLN